MQTRKRLKSRKPLKPISERRVRQLNSEVTARIALCKRCGGIPIQKSSNIHFDWGFMELNTIMCIGGTCEVCGKPAGDERMSPHEKHHRSLGGQVSLENSLMCHWACHKKEQKSEPMFGVKNE